MVASARRWEGCTPTLEAANTDRVPSSHGTEKEGRTPHTWLAGSCPHGVSLSTHCHEG